MNFHYSRGSIDLDPVVNYALTVLLLTCSHSVCLCVYLHTWYIMYLFASLCITVYLWLTTYQPIIHIQLCVYHLFVYEWHMYCHLCLLAFFSIQMLMVTCICMYVWQYTSLPCINISIYLHPNSKNVVQCKVW